MTIKLGLLSTAHLHADAYVQAIRAIPDVTLIGFADEDAERGREFARRFNARQFPSYQDLLAEQPDGVIICSENNAHRPLAELAARAGVHILSEKPLATTLADARAILAAAQAAGVMVMTAFPMRFSAPLCEVKAMLDNGSLGRVYALNTTNQGQMPAVHKSWFVDPVLAGGGAVMDHTVHLADIMRWFLKQEVTTVYAQTNHIMHAHTVSVETGGLLLLTFADGTFASLDCSWSKPLNYPTWGGLKLELITERGLTVVDAFSQNLNIFNQKKPANTWSFWGSDPNQAMIEEFVDAIRQQRPPAVTGEDGLCALQIVLAAYRSAQTGQPEAVEL